MTKRSMSHWALLVKVAESSAVRKEGVSLLGEAGKLVAWGLDSQPGQGGKGTETAPREAGVASG